MTNLIVKEQTDGHLTATDKRNIRNFMTKGIKPGQTGYTGKGKNGKRYEFREIAPDRRSAKIVIWEWYIDWSRSYWRDWPASVKFEQRNRQPAMEQGSLF